MFTQVGTFITGWIWNPITGMAESFGGWIFPLGKWFLG